MTEQSPSVATSLRDAVGLIGVGLMGKALARRLVDAGFPLIGFDVDQEKRARLTEIGGRAADSTGDVARQCRHVLVAVFSGDQVDEVIGEIGTALSRGSGARKVTLISVVTCDPGRAVALDRRAASAGLGFLEVPISGTSDQVLRGDGVGLIGGDEPRDAELIAVLDAFVPRRFHVGKVGDGAKAKLAVNLILGLNRLALAEGLAFAEQMGLDPQTFFRIARGSAAHSQVMDTKGGKMVSGDFAPQGRVVQALKDAHLMLDEARRLGQELPLCAVNVDVLEACVRSGDGERDSTVVIEELRRRRTAGGQQRGAARR